jgi:type VI secretion system protein ImpM
MGAGFGAYGKIPALGDFFRLNLSGDFVEPWDHWLQETLVASRMSLGAEWDGAYNQAPIWRFTLRRAREDLLAVSCVL